MSLVVCVKYTDDSELQHVTERLQDLDLRVSKEAYTDGGRFRRVYLKSKDVTKGTKAAHQTEE